MKARVQSGKLGEPLILPNVQSVVIYDDYDQPIMLIQHMAEGRILSTRATDASFPALLKSMGIGLNAKYHEVKV